MQTIDIDNPEIESFITSKYGDDTQSLLDDFMKFMKLSLDDGYPVITKEDEKKEVAQAVEEVNSATEKLLGQSEYDDEMHEDEKFIDE